MKKNLRFKIAVITGLISPYCYGENIYFNIDSLMHGTKDQNIHAIDLSVFTQQDYFPDGNYLVDIYVNNQFIASDFVEFIQNEQTTHLQPLFSQAQIKTLGIILPKNSNKQQDSLVNLQQSIPDSTSKFNYKKGRLDISVPQINIKKSPHGYVNPNQWQQGISAFRLNYSISGFHAHGKYGRPDTENYFTTLNSGLNLGAWRIRNNSTWQKGTDHKSSWKSLQTYATRDIHSLKSRLIVGEYDSSSGLFDSFAYTGIELSSDKNMLPDSMRGFAPIIRGTALTNARVVIKQSGNILYQTNVSPGPFEINDLYATSSGESLEVTIIESDGQERTFWHSFAAVPIMEREGQFTYSFIGGKYRNSGDIHSDEPEFMQGSIIYGLPYDSTAYLGAIFSKNYMAEVIGIGKSLGDFGALSFDITQAKSEIPRSNKTFNGQSYRLQYSKRFASTNTSLSISMQRYSEEPFYTFKEASEYQFTSSYNQNNKKESWKVHLSQYINKYGNLYLSATSQNYWNNEKKENYYNAGYSITGWGGITYSANIAHNKITGEKRDNQISLGIQIPFEKYTTHPIYFNYNYLHGSSGQSSNSVSLYGSALENNNFNYSIQKTITNQKNSDSGSISLSYLGSKALASIGYSQDHFNEQYNYNLSGGLVAHSEGITLSQQLGETVILVDTGNVSDVAIQNYPTITTDLFGNAVLPYANIYKINNVSIDVNKLDLDTDATSAIKMVVPTRGAIAKASFTVQQGYRVLLTLYYQGNILPFGTSVIAIDEHGKQISGIIGAEGELYLSGLSNKTYLKVGLQNNQTCSTEFTLNNANSNEIQFIKLECY